MTGLVSHVIWYVTSVTTNPKTYTTARSAGMIYLKYLKLNFFAGIPIQNYSSLEHVLEEMRTITIPKRCRRNQSLLNQSLGDIFIQ